MLVENIKERISCEKSHPFFQIDNSNQQNMKNEELPYFNFQYNNKKHLNDVNYYCQKL